jgi:hypothetical protein
MVRLTETDALARSPVCDWAGAAEDNPMAIGTMAPLATISRRVG